MPTIVIQHPLKSSEMEALRKEFPYFAFVEEKTNDMEVFFGSSLHQEDLEAYPLLRWIHLPSPSISQLPTAEIQKRGNILVTFTPSSGIENHGEWAIASALSLLKGFFGQASPLALANKTWLELFIEGKRARSNAKWAKKLDLKVIGLQRGASFAPYADRTYDFQERKQHLPQADILSLTTDPRTPDIVRLKEEELSLIKKGAILLISTSSKRVNWPLLEKMIQANHFQGVAIDTTDPLPLTPHPRLLITPYISMLPTPSEDPAFPLFRHLLRDYLHENFVDMSPRWES